MKYNPYAQHEVHCDDFGRAMSPQVSYQEHMKNDDRESLGFRKQSKVLLLFSPFVTHIAKRFWTILFLLVDGILHLQFFLLLSAYIVFCFLGIVFLFSVLQFLRAFFDVLLYKPCDKLGKYVIDRLPFLYVAESRIMALSRCIFDKVLSPYNPFNKYMETSISC